MQLNHSHKKYALLFLGMLFICVSTTAALAMMQFAPDGNLSDSEIVTPIQNPFVVPILEAQSAYVYDVKEGRMVYDKNGNDVRPLASITKAMTVFTALDFYSSTSSIIIGKQALSSEGDTGLMLGEVWKFNDLLNFTMLTSSNDGAVALASSAVDEEQFIRRMNEKASMIGLSTLRFNNETGLDLNGAASGGYGSAKDVAVLFASILETAPKVLEITRYDDYSFTSQSGITHHSSNTDTAVNKIPGILASKTGFTDLAGGNLVIAFDVEIGHPIVVAVLGSSYSGRFDDVVALASSTRAFYFQN